MLNGGTCFCLTGMVFPCYERCKWNLPMLSFEAMLLVHGDVEHFGVVSGCRCSGFQAVCYQQRP